MSGRRMGITARPAGCVDPPFLSLPATVAVALAIQWTALARSALGRPAGWKGRAYSAADGA